jgi:hypothetical protein
MEQTGEFCITLIGGCAHVRACVFAPYEQSLYSTLSIVVIVIHYLKPFQPSYYQSQAVSAKLVTTDIKPPSPSPIYNKEDDHD